MNVFLRLVHWRRGFAALFLFTAFLPSAWAQFSAAPPLGKILRVVIRHVGPAKVSDEYIRAHVRVKPGDDYLPPALDDDIHTLYATGFFYNIQAQRKEE